MGNATQARPALRGRRVSPNRDELGAVLNPGERRVFDFFDEHLPLEWEIYAQPHLNGLKPDFVLLNPNAGIAVFEVKDWNLGAMDYELDASARPPKLFGRQNGGPRFAIESPVEKLHLYRTEITRLYCPGLDSNGGIAAVSAGVIAPSASTMELEALLGPAIGFRARTESARRYLRLVGGDLLDSGDVATVLLDAARKSSLHMRPELADDLRHWLVEPDFSAQQRRRPALDSRQRLVVETRTETGYRRVRGPAGSGKTLALAGRAATLAQEGKSVLVVSYNLTLLNFLRDAAVRFGADPRRITWLNFHAWCKRVLIQLGREDDYRALFRSDGDRDLTSDPSEVLDHALPDLVREALALGDGRVDTYDAVLVDEGQDMLPGWWEALRKVAKPRPTGEMLLVADRGQDVYLRNSAWTEEAMLGAGFSGPWFDLKTSYRMPRQLTELARVFLERFHPDADTLLPEPPAQQELETDICRLVWIQSTEDAMGVDAVEAVRRMIVASRVDRSDVDLAFADVVVLCDRLALGRDLVTRLGERNVRVVDTFAADPRAQRRQKQYFFKGSEKVKATTFHSFKGWEGRSLVVVVGSARGVAERRALYAGITRLKAHPHGSYLTVVCADPGLREFGELWPVFEKTGRTS